MEHKEEHKSELELDHTLIETTHKVEHFYHDYKKQINIVALVAILAVAGYFGYTKFILAPQEKEAQEAIFPAQTWFEKDSFDLALKGQGEKLGFEAVAENYGLTKAGNLAHYYAGVCLMRKGEYQAAIDHLDKFSNDNELVGPMATGLKGDAYSELKEYDKAAKLYMKAAAMSKNKLTSPIFLKKAGLTFEELKQYDDAVSAYEKIKNEFSDAQEAQDIDKYIARATAEKGN
ncbi:MAG: tetratricopeptide repeat protein [Bacteroidetes bacterium B1(2017)]|nr:MAG: tetratricopeptide repeat protein [Bacteroidetes bacterium B1(2017)]